LAVEDVYQALWRHKIFIVLMTVLMVGVTWFATSAQTRIYESSALVRVQQKITDPTQSVGALTAGGLLAQTYANIVTTKSIANRISAATGRRISPNEVDVSASPVNNLDLLWVKARSSSPRVAEIVAGAAPRALEKFIRQTGTLRDQVITVQPAALPTHPVKPNLKFNLTVALLLALIFNSALALLIDMFSDRAKDLDELERITGLSVLATVPKLSFSGRSGVEVLPVTGSGQPATAGNGGTPVGDTVDLRRGSRALRGARRG
jgi:capsular polysaccharide biosynthesis protein